MCDEKQNYDAFVPEILKQLLCDTPDISALHSQSFESVVVALDICGYGVAVQSLSTDKLQQKVNEIVRHGGDVVKYVGDLLLCVWRPPPETLENEYAEQFHANKAEQKDDQELSAKHAAKEAENKKMQTEAVPKNARAAIQCAMDLQKKYGSACNAAFPYKLNIGVGAGSTILRIVGGVDNQFEYVLYGDAVRQAYECSFHSARGKTSISQQVAALEIVQTSFEVAKNDASATSIEVTKIKERTARTRWTMVRADAENGLSPKLKQFIPKLVTDASKGALQDVCIVFVGSTGKMSSLGDDKAIQELQALVSSLQTATLKHGGSLHNLNVDELGTAMFALFPGVATKQAVLSALEVSAANQVSIGVARGTCFVGEVGTQNVRASRTVIGPKLNFSARLMSMCKKNPDKFGAIAVDQSVYKECKSEAKIKFTEGMNIVVKGVKEQVQVYGVQYAN